MCIASITFILWAPSDISLNGDGSPPHTHVLLSHQPASDCLLDADTGSSQLICPYFFKIGYLTSPEKYFCLTKLVLILVLFSEVKRWSVIALNVNRLKKKKKSMKKNSATSLVLNCGTRYSWYQSCLVRSLHTFADGSESLLELHIPL